jgi:hypothetical protein
MTTLRPLRMQGAWDLLAVGLADQGSKIISTYLCFTFVT